MERWIVVDLDGTMCDAAHRVGYAQAGEWEDFHSRLMEDKPVLAVCNVVEALMSGYKIMALTGRNEKWRNLTLEWMMRHQCYFFDEIFMRPDDDYRPDVEMKLGKLEEFFGDKETVLASVVVVLEDREKVVEAMRNYGLAVFQVREGDY